LESGNDAAVHNYRSIIVYDMMNLLLTKPHIAAKIRPVQKASPLRRVWWRRLFLPVYIDCEHPLTVMEVELAGQKSEYEIVEIPLETIPESSSEDNDTSQPADEKTIEAEIVRVNQSGVLQVNAGKVEIQQGGANRVYAEQVTVNQGAAGIIQATSVTVEQGGLGFVRAGEVNIDESTVQTMVADTITANGGTAGLLVAREVHANPLRAFVVLAQKIDGQIDTTLDTRGAILAGLIAGIAAGLVSLVGRLLTQRKR